MRSTKIRVEFLPSYAPNLNLIERLWKFFKKKTLRGKYYEKFSEFREATMGFFKNLGQHANELNTLLTDKFHIIDTT